MKKVEVFVLSVFIILILSACADQMSTRTRDMFEACLVKGWVPTYSNNSGSIITTSCVPEKVALARANNPVPVAKEKESNIETINDVVARKPITPKEPVRPESVSKQTWEQRNNN